MTELTFDSSKRASDREPRQCSPGVDPLAFPASFESIARPQIDVCPPSGHHAADCCCYVPFRCVWLFVSLVLISKKICHEFNCKYEKLATRSHSFIFYFRANAKNRSNLLISI